MILDIIFLLVVIGAFYAGFKQGIIYALISFVSIFIGVIAALNFSTFVGIYLIKNFNFPEFINSSTIIKIEAEPMFPVEDKLVNHFSCGI